MGEGEMFTAQGGEIPPKKWDGYTTWRPLRWGGSKRANAGGRGRGRRGLPWAACIGR
jgi:hypothetical protein